MATTVGRLCRNVTREQRSLWMGHVVKEGSRRTGNQRSIPNISPTSDALPNFVMQQLQVHCYRKLFAIELRLNRNELARIAAQKGQKMSYLQLVAGRR
jgi:hypothetical protein